MTTTTRTVPTRVLLTGGVVAGPLFVAVVAAQVLTREGVDLSRHALSWLALGEAGAIQIAACVVTGVLMLGLAAGARRVLHPGPAGTWGPALLGLVVAAVVVALLGRPGYDGITLRLAAATVVMSLWTTVLALHLRAAA